MDIDYVANLARMDLTKEEKDKLGKQMEDILKYIEKLNQLDTKNTQPTAHVIPMKNVWREDKNRPSLKRETFEKFAKYMENGFFKVPPVIE